MTFSKSMRTSNSDNWATPQELFDKLDDKYNFTYDVCAGSHNAKCSQYYTVADDGLKQKWQGTCWCNPPYSRQIGLWMEKAYKSSVLGATVVCLVPARTDTRWWNSWSVKGEIEYIKGRLKFGSSNNSAPFPSAIITYRPPSIQHYGVFPDFDIMNEINVWEKGRIPIMAPWLLPYLNKS